ncbi:MAG: polymer-forming cytoskeletal protein [Pseudomonadota bacterium]
MGILNRDRSQQHSSGGSTIIAAITELDGRFTLADNLHIDGQVEGDIRSTADITLGEQGRFTGTIEARRVYVSGQINGNVKAQRVEIINGGSMQGDLLVSDLVIEPGGRFCGNSTILGRDEAPERAGDVASSDDALDEAVAKPS